jgi:RND superfamily putative drug exporter
VVELGGNRARGVVALAFILLTLAFRTVWVPIMSILGFLLSMAAALGVEVAVFQWGWGASLLGITKSSVTLSYLPIILLAIIFGLSSDYQLFVVSRIKEHFTKTGDARDAVRRGTGVSVRVVMPAALIMFSIFVAFMTTSNVAIKPIAFSFAIGVLIDAFVVRLTLVPAVMAIVGRRIWFHSQWFERHVPNPDIEGQRLKEQLALGVAEEQRAPAARLPGPALGAVAWVGGLRRRVAPRGRAGIGPVRRASARRRSRSGR